MKLGTTSKDELPRDSVHVCCGDAIAAERLAPGMHVKLDSDQRTARECKPDQGQGIVDPFLKSVVKPGEHFYIWVYPGRVGALHHAWEHPDFPPMSSIKIVNEPSVIPKPLTSAEQYLTNYAAMTGRTMMDVIKEANRNLDEGTKYDSIFDEKPSEKFWSAFKEVTGRDRYGDGINPSYDEYDNCRADDC
jgi:hypothetical protein